MVQYNSIGISYEFNSDNKNGRQFSVPEDVYLALHDAHSTTTCIAGYIKKKKTVDHVAHSW